MFLHIPVLYDEVMKGLAPHAGGVYADGTLGGGGHAQGVLELSAPDGQLFAVDQDEVALQAAAERLAVFGDRVHLERANYVALPELLKDHYPEGVDGILLDIGVSSPQIDEPSRGFSYMHDAPLDMRMDQRADLDAKTIINTYDTSDLVEIIKTYGEENWAVRIAEMINEHRRRAPVETTFQLVDIIERAIPKGAREKHSHVAKRTFQALRIAVNDELGVLERSIEGLVDALAPGGRLAIITFHSLEDRIVKNSFKTLASHCICPPKQPICTCHHQAKIKIITRKPIMASAEENANNRRAASAKLRIAEKLVLQ